MLVENPRGAGTGNDYGTHIVLAIFADDIGTHDAGDLRYIQNADGDDDANHRLAENRNEHSGQGDARHRHKHVENSHDDLGNPRTAHRCDGTDDHAKNQGEENREQTDHQRIAGTVENTRHHVTTHLVGSEKMIAARWLITHSDRQRILWGDQWSEHSHQNQ